MIDRNRNLPDVRARSSLRKSTTKRVADWTTGGSRGITLKSASDYVDDLSPVARKFLEYLLERPHYSADADELVEVLGLTSRRSLGSSTSIFGHLRAKHGKFQPFEVTQRPGVATIYFILHETADVLKRVMYQPACVAGYVPPPTISIVPSLATTGK